MFGDGGATRLLALEPTTDAVLWDQLVAELPGATAFHSWAWLDLQAELFGLPIERLLLVQGARAVGVWPTPHRPRSPSTSSLPFPFVGPVLPPDLLPLALTAYRRRQWRTGLLLGRAELGPDLADGAHLALRASGMTWHPERTVVVATGGRTVEQVRDGYIRSHRKSLRRAARAGVHVRPSEPGEVATLLPRLLTESYGVRGVPSPYPEHVGLRVEQWADGRDDVRTATALVGDRAVGVLVGLGGAPVHVAWAGGCLREFRDAAPNVPLYDDLIAWAVAPGAAAVDLAGEVDEGIMRFKLGFHGEERAYLTVESFLGPRAALRLTRAAVDQLTP